jgi:hypothetical protein
MYPFTPLGTALVYKASFDDDYLGQVTFAQYLFERVPVDGSE